MKKLRHALKYKRARKGLTNYKTRLALLKSAKTRLVVRTKGKTVVVQLVDYHPDGDKVRFTITSRELTKLGWGYGTKNISAAYLTGLLCKRAKGVKEAILDAGKSSLTKGNVIYGVMKGACDAGINVPHTAEILPPEERITGKHIAAYAKQLRESDEAKYKRCFSKYLKEHHDPEKIAEAFAAVKAKIMEA